jgi:hypothetical protein
MLLAKIAYAQNFSTGVQNSAAGSIISKIVEVIVDPAVQLLFAVTVLIFIWGLFKMIAHGDDPTARSEGQKHVLWGVIGMAIMVSVYGIIQVISNTVTP